MLAIKAHYDGKKVVLPKSIHRKAPAEVIVIFNEPEPKQDGAELFAKAQEAAFARVWDNEDDAIYDSL
ncbi:MAG TPA: hypothetical protein VKX17_14960 [Planctomycetota bacterium]|nr:hypothetical protein [Planctomycetota bacterium]